MKDELSSLLGKAVISGLTFDEGRLLAAQIDSLNAEVERLKKALVESEAQADWLWSELRSTDAPHRLWKDASSTTQEHYRFHAEHRLIERGVIAKS